jgi:hypothetical protein
VVEDSYCDVERTVTSLAGRFHASFIGVRDHSTISASQCLKTFGNNRCPKWEPGPAHRRLWGVRQITANRRKDMDLPLFIAILALLAWTLLPQLDRYADSDAGAERKRSYLSRLARWVNN